MKIEIINEKEITPDLDLKIREGLCRSFPQYADTFIKTRYWNGILPVSSIVLTSDDGSSTVIAHAGIIKREMSLEDGEIARIYQNRNFAQNDVKNEEIKSIILEKSSATLKGAARVVSYPYPEESIREAIVNAVAHRDYTISGIDIRVDIYPDRLEIESPGKLPNTLSLESIRLGAKYYRNQILVQYLKEAGFMDLHSLGIPVKILKLCAEYTGREPDLTESENSFKVTLYPKKKATVGKVEEEILKLLRTSAEPMKTREISDAIGLSKRTTINWINRLIEKNMVEPTSENRNDPNCRYRPRY